MTLGPVLYKCDYCGWQTRKEREDLICPDCGRTLARFAMNLDEPGNFLTEEVFEKFPCVLAHEYRRLCYLARAENIYGVFLQLKDVIEVIIKLPVLIGMSWGKKYDVEGRSAYEKKLSKEKIALGVWVETADAIKKLFSNSSIRNTEKALPQPVWSILKDLHEWVVNNELTEWRNLQLAHGALALEDNDDFKQDMIRKIRAVTAFVERKKEELSKIVIMSDGKELIGSSSARNLPMFSGSCEIKVNDDIIPAAPFIVHYNYGIFFYDELLSDTYSRVLSYPMGRAERYHDDDISLLYKLKSGKTISSENDAESEFVTKTELDFVNRVACKNDFVEPEYISNWLRDFLNDNKSGIFLLEMERGCGKSYYTEMLNRRHMNHIDLVNDLDVRTYHISWSQNREINEFIEGIESEWCFAYEKTPDEDLAYSAHIVYDHDDPRNNAAALCRYLEKVRDYTSRSDSRQRKERIMLVLDGMDEISETNDHIWSFIPKPTMLPEGVYILLTGRIPDEENISKNYAKRINSIELTRRETVRSNNPNNVEQLRKYIHIACAGSVNSEIEDKIIDYAECRFLPMRMLCNNLNYNQSINLSTKDIKSMIASYVDWIINLYGDCRKEMIITFLSILSLRDGTVRFTLREIADLLNMGGIKWELIGLLSDISPMLMIYRNHTLYGKSYFAENSYQLINKDVADSIKEYLGDEKYTGVCFSIMKNAVDTLRDIDLNSRPDGRLVIMSDLIELCQEIGKNEWLLEQIPNICRDFVDKEKQVPDILNSKTEIVDGKTHYLLRTICSRICNLYHKNQKDGFVKYSEDDLRSIADVYGLLLFLMNDQCDHSIDELRELLVDFEYVLHHCNYKTSKEKLDQAGLLGILTFYCNNDVYNYSGLHEQTLQFSKEAVDVLEKMDNLPAEDEELRLKMLTNAKNTLAISYRHSGSSDDLETAKKLLLELISNVHDDQMLGNLYLNLANVISNQGEKPEKTKELYLKSISYFAKDTIEKSASEDMQATIYENIARTYYYKGEYDQDVIFDSYRKAIEHTLESMKYIHGLVQQAKLARLWNDYGHVAKQINVSDKKLIKTCTMNSLEILERLAVEDSAYEDQVLNGYTRLIDNSIETKDFLKINSYFDKAIASLDRVYERLLSNGNSADAKYAYTVFFTLLQLSASDVKVLANKYNHILLERYATWLQNIECPISNEDTILGFQNANDMMLEKLSESPNIIKKLYSRIIVSIPALVSHESGGMETVNPGHRKPGFRS